MAIMVIRKFLLSSFVILYFSGLVQQSNSDPIPEEQNSKLTDKYAQEAADALDNMILMFKKGIDTLLEDGNMVGNAFYNLTEKISQIVPRNDNQEKSSITDTHKILEEMSKKANKTLYENLYKSDD